jgi:hypothetical protein
MVLAAIVHAEVATAGAFASHNGLIARLATRLILVERGVDPASVTVPEAGHLALRADYGAGLASYAGGELDGVRLWLLHCSQAFSAGAEAAADLVGR